MKCPICNKETWNCNPVRWGPEFAHRECVARIGPQPFAGPDWPEGPLQDDDWAGDDPPESIGAVWCSCEECRPEWHYGREEPDAPCIDPARIDMLALYFIEKLRHKTVGCTIDDGRRLSADIWVKNAILAHMFPRVYGHVALVQS